MRRYGTRKNREHIILLAKAGTGSDRLQDGVAPTCSGGRTAGSTSSQAQKLKEAAHEKDWQKEPLDES